MSQKSEDSIERFFRKGVVQQDKTFMERDWQSMEKMLDEQAMAGAATRAARSKIAAKLGVGVVLISFLFLIGVENNTPENTVQMQAAVGALGPRTKVKIENPAADLHSSEKKQATEDPRNISSVPRTIAAKRLAKSIGEPAKLKKRNPQSEATEILDGTVSPSFSNSGQGDLNSESVPVSKSSQDALGVAPALIDQNPNEDGVGLQSKVPVNSSNTSSLELNKDTSKAAVELTKTDEALPLLTDSAPAEETSEKETNGNNRPKFNITALISPDFSTTTLSRYSKPSNVFGMLVGYRISQRFTIMAGATKSLKRYEGYGKEYTPPEGYWQSRTNGIIPDEVEGQCGIIEVPLMIQFDLLQRSKNRMFFSAGVSSYFMRSERYQYTFNEPNPGAANSWTAKEPTKYLFKIGHLSAGYDHLIAKKFTIGIEPFLKVPFEGIGWTNINLYSTGAYINFRYNILNIH